MEIELFDITHVYVLDQIAALFPDISLANACNTVVVCFQSVADWTSMYCIPVPTPIAIAFAVPTAEGPYRGLELTICIVQEQPDLFVLMLDQIMQVNNGTTMRMKMPTDPVQKAQLTNAGFECENGSNMMYRTYEKINTQ